MKKTLITLLAFAFLVPAVALGQVKYTNADLDIPPKKDAYTNADLGAPLPTQPSPIKVLQPMPILPMLEEAREEAAYRAEQYQALDDLDAEIRWWEGVLKVATTGLTSNPNQWPHYGSDTSEAQVRLQYLYRVRYMMESSMGVGTDQPDFTSSRMRGSWR